MVFEPDDTPYVPEMVCEEKEGGMYLLLAPELPNCISVNAEAKAVIDLCDGTKTIREITEVISCNLGENPEENLSDMINFFNYLERKKFVFNHPVHTDEPLLRTPDHLEELWLNITNRCNLQCRHCHSFFGNPLQNELTTEEIMSIIEAASPHEKCNLIISGGEPFCRKDVTEILKAAVHFFGDRVFVITNGTLIDDETAEKLASLQVKIQISFEGPDQESNDTIRGKGTFEKAVKTLRILKKLGAKVSVRMTLLKTNMDKIEKIIIFSKTEGVAPVPVNTLKRGGRALECVDDIDVTTDELIKTYRRIRELDPDSHYIIFDESLRPGINRMEKRDLCVAGCRILSVDAEGGVYPCSGLMYPEFLAGNIRETPLEEIWKESPGLKEIQNLSIAQIPECKECLIRYLCGGGCFVDVFWEHGNVKGKTPRCEFLYTMKWDELKQTKYKKRSWGQ